MKKYICAMLSLAMLASCSGNGGYQVSGKFDDVADEDLCLMFLVKGYTRCDHCDTLHVDANGEFAFNNVDRTVFGQILITKFNPDGTATYDPYILLPVLPDEYVKISGKLSEPVYDGSKFYRQMNEYQDLVKEPYDKITALSGEYQAKFAAAPDKTDSLMAEYNKTIEELQTQYSSIQSDWIARHPSDNFAGYLAASQYSPEDFDKSYEALSASVRNGVMAPYLENTRKLLKEMAERKAAMGHVAEGEEAPDFTLKTLEGRDFTLSSLRGKYVMLDFWGSWCKWCIKGIPTLKDIYSRHSSKLEIVSIACNDSDDKWRKAVEENEMSWIQVRNTDDDKPVDARYGVEGYPTFVIIDPEGVVLKQFVGETDDFVPYMDNLLK